MPGVTLVHHLSHSAPSVSGFDSDDSPATSAVFVPSGRECDHFFRQRMEFAVALGGAPSVPAASKVVESENGVRSRGFVAGGMMMSIGFAGFCVCEIWKMGCKAKEKHHPTNTRHVAQPFYYFPSVE
ncbi:unnamed protein product [Sphenostylis stenocarpa]|uniref:Uncharacterized protein n=1 Tax=Sphenostylis stenocarpa TaxID=92480 RepID=A0AA87B6S6_9FABA|nr:unnamed protein product [Sphenostylis stenocarpa]